MTCLTTLKKKHEKILMENTYVYDNLYMYPNVYLNKSLLLLAVKDINFVYLLICQASI